MAAALKQLSKKCLADAAERVDADGASEEQLLTELSVSTLVALEAVCDDDEHRRDIKRLRKALQRREFPAPEGSASAKSDGADLGQYAAAEVFNGDKRKADKFARLMGGAKAGGSVQHDTAAASAAEQASRQRELTSQFEAAAQRRGSARGLGK